MNETTPPPSPDAEQLKATIAELKLEKDKAARNLPPARDTPKETGVQMHTTADPAQFKALIDSLKQEREEAAQKLQTAETKLAETGANTWNQTTSLASAGAILAFTLVLFGLMSWLILKGKHAPTILMRTFTVPLVCVMAVILVLVGYSKDQIIPVIGLLGTVAGYLLGRNDSGQPPEHGAPHQAGPPRTAGNPGTERHEEDPR
ncbi:hypothetical protein [Luteolibacter sp. LG18]|uniref:hypothetical protein n=1 Tax=Luteolibacter sp. LG18 TaxID=2819286 RepID=UPI002B2A17A6|nr:hypothetical protein llg_26310 [Luteolibacter sp. LG18]